MNISVKLKLAGGFGLVILLSLAAGGVAWRNQQAMQATIQDFATTRMQQVRLIGDVSPPSSPTQRPGSSAVIRRRQTIENSGRTRDPAVPRDWPREWIPARCCYQATDCAIESGNICATVPFGDQKGTR